MEFVEQGIFYYNYLNDKYKSRRNGKGGEMSSLSPFWVLSLSLGGGIRVIRHSGKTYLRRLEIETLTLHLWINKKNPSNGVKVYFYFSLNLRRTIRSVKAVKKCCTNKVIVELKPVAEPQTFG